MERNIDISKHYTHENKEFPVVDCRIISLSHRH